MVIIIMMMIRIIMYNIFVYYNLHCRLVRSIALWRLYSFVHCQWSLFKSSGWLL